MKTVKCPTCKETLTEIGVVSEYNQTYNLETKEFNSDNSEVGQTIYTFCPKCGIKLPLSSLGMYLKKILGVPK